MQVKFWTHQNLEKENNELLERLLRMLGIKKTVNQLSFVPFISNVKNQILNFSQKKEMQQEIDEISLNLVSSFNPVRKLKMGKNHFHYLFLIKDLVGY